MGVAKTIVDSVIVMEDFEIIGGNDFQRIFDNPRSGHMELFPNQIWQ